MSPRTGIYILRLPFSRTGIYIFSPAVFARRLSFTALKMPYEDNASFPDPHGIRTNVVFPQKSALRLCMHKVSETAYLPTDFRFLQETVWLQTDVSDYHPVLWSRYTIGLRNTRRKP